MSESVVANDREERRCMDYEPAGPTRAEHAADENPPYTRPSRTSGDFLADLEQMRGVTPSEEDERDVQTALHAADAGNAGHWPTVAAVLADEVRRLRAALDGAA